MEQANAKGLGSPTDAFSLYSMAFVRGDKVGMERAVELGKGSSVEPIMLMIVAEGQCSLGKIQSARQSFAQGISSAQKSGLKELSADIRLVESACLAEVGNPVLPGRGRHRRWPLRTIAIPAGAPRTCSPGQETLAGRKN